ncbi:MAG TPA: PepSY domain-containing protein, partial [Gemmataceae bacterium]
YKDGAAYELTVDGRSGRILSEHRDDAEPRPPRGARPLSQILHLLIKAGYTNIHDVSFERRYWEIEAYRGDGKRELHVQPTTGEVIRDRRDD